LLFSKIQFYFFETKNWPVSFIEQFKEIFFAGASGLLMV